MQLVNWFIGHPPAMAALGAVLMGILDLCIEINPKLEANTVFMAIKNLIKSTFKKDEIKPE